MKKKNDTKIMGWATSTTPAAPATKQLAKVPAQRKPKVKPLYDLVAARREITDEDYARFDRLVPQGRHVIRDADEPWSCE